MDTATTEIYTYWHALALHDALPICVLPVGAARRRIKAEAVVGELAGAQRSLARPREQHRHVGLAPRGVEEAAGGDKVDLDIGMRGDEAREARRAEAVADPFGHADPHLPRQIRSARRPVDACPRPPHPPRPGQECPAT